MSAEPSTTDPVPDGTPAIAFSEKEERVLKVAWTCLKAGPPEVDIAKLTKAGGFNTAKTAANTWGVIKKKLAQLSPPVAAGDDTVEGATSPTPKTPKTKGTPKKRAQKSDSAEGDDQAAADEDESPPKKQRKSPAKKTPAKVKAEEATNVKEEAVEEVAEGGDVE